jgi:glycosyltransferase involved in cell wall biosynthesis
VIICAPLIQAPIPPTHSPYSAQNIELLPIQSAGGNTFNAKVDLFVKSYSWWKALQELLRKVDFVHIRCPNNISILGLMALQFTKSPRQAVFTGSWLGHPGEALTYRWQRLFLKHIFKGPVAVYGNWPNQPHHIVPSFSPSYSIADWEMESAQVQSRIDCLSSQAHVSQPIHLISVGSLNRNKNQQLVIQAVDLLRSQGRDCLLELIGDGDQRLNLEAQVKALDLTDRVVFFGSVSQAIVRERYRQSDFAIQAPYSEGYGKVPIEAFFHGVIPILSNVDVSLQIIGGNQRGRCFPQGDAQAIAQHVIDLADNPSEMAELIYNGREYAKGLTLEAWGNHLHQTLSSYWNIRPTILRINPKI